MRETIAPVVAPMPLMTSTSLIVSLYHYPTILLTMAQTSHRTQKSQGIELTVRGNIWPSSWGLLKYFYLGYLVLMITIRQNVYSKTCYTYREGNAWNLRITKRHSVLNSKYVCEGPISTNIPREQDERYQVDFRPRNTIRLRRP
ncbi:hypothetical protein F4818DRAFT_311784 [Hypoxylon cercidicola]|nr:hypothetical protein F4818DRAFT_311784 [Hypoxylon cercidicola]